MGEDFVSRLGGVEPSLLAFVVPAPSQSARRNGAPSFFDDFNGWATRQTAWAVQQWTELQSQHRDPYTVLGLLTTERVRRATQIMQDLTMDLDSLEMGLETEGLEKLYRAVKGLHERLLPLFRRNVG